jgi:hypothetical protein
MVRRRVFGLTKVYYFLQWNQPDALISQICSWNKTLHVSGSSSVHHQEFFTVYTAMVYAIQVCWQLASRITMELQFHPDPLLWHIPLLCIQWKTPDDGQRNCSKHAEFHSNNKIEKLMHQVCFILRNLTRCTVTWTSNLPRLWRIHVYMFITGIKAFQV